MFIGLHIRVLIISFKKGEKRRLSLILRDWKTMRGK